MTTLKCAIFVGACVLAAAVAVRAEEQAVPAWPQFRGPGGSGVAAEGRYPVEFGPDKNVVWKAELPSGVSSPCVWGDQVFLTGYTPVTKTLETLCLDRSTGNVLWRRKAPAKAIEQVYAVSSPANATPATDGTRAYVYFPSCGLMCYDLEGNEVWKRPLPLNRTRFGSGTSPVLAGDLLILNRDFPGFNLFNSSSILAVKCETGETAWETNRGAAMVCYSSPANLAGRQDGGSAQVLLAGSFRLTGYNLADGKEAWWVDGLPPQVVGVPVLDGDRVYLSATGMYGEPEGIVEIPTFDDFLQGHDADKDGAIDLAEISRDLLLVDRRASGGAGNSPLLQFTAAFDSDKNKEVTKKEWESFRSRAGKLIGSEPGVYAIRLGGKGDVTGSHVVWKETKGAAEVPSLLVYEGRLYSVRNGGLVHCRGAEDGRELFTGRLGAVGGYYASPVAGDGKIYFASDQGVVTVLQAAGELSVLAQNDLGERIMATPALVDSTLYVRTDGHLYAFRSLE